MGWKEDLWAPFTDESLAKVTLPQLANLSFLGQQLLLPDGHLTPKGWGLAAALVSSIVCLALYKLTRPFTYALFPSYRKLSHADRRNWDSRYSSNIHAVLCVYFAYYCVWADDLFWKEHKTPQILRTSAQTYIGLGMSFGYFFIDFISCVKYMMGGMEMLLHHVGSLLAVTTALLTGDAHMHTLWMLVTEFTTPLINNRWWLDKMELKHTLFYVVNGLAVLFCWVPARLMVFPPFFYVVWQHRRELVLITHVSKFLVAAVPVILTTLNVYWFTRIVLGAYKVLFGPSRKPKAE